MTKKESKEQYEKKFFELKQGFASFVHGLKMEAIKRELQKQTTIIGLKENIRKDLLTDKEVKSLWENGKKVFSL